MKKIISILLLLAVALSLCACGGEAKPSAEQAQQADPQPAEDAAPSADELAVQALELFYSGDYEEAFTQLSGLEASGVGYVNELLGLCHYHGYGTDIDAEAAVEILKPLAESGSCLANYIMAGATFSGNGTTQDPALADELYTAAVKAANETSAASGLYASALFVLADCYARGLGVEKDLSIARTAAAEAAAMDTLSVFEMFELAKIFEIIDKAQAKAAEAATEAGAAEAAGLEPATPSEEARAADKLYGKARESIALLAESGNATALKFLGDYYFGSLGGFGLDYSKAMEYYLLAADQDNADAQAQLGLMYQDGLGVEANYEQAMEWNNRAAQQGNAQGQAQIGYLYHMGLGVTQNLNEAGRWYSRAADQGNEWAAEKLAETEITNPQAAFEFHA